MVTKTVAASVTIEAILTVIQLVTHITLVALVMVILLVGSVTAVLFQIEADSTAADRLSEQSVLTATLLILIESLALRHI